MKTEDKEKTLRQQMRESASSELDGLVEKATFALEAEAKGSPVSASDLARLIIGGQTKTLRDKMIGQIADVAERDLVKMWNNQQKLNLESNSD